MTVCGDCGGTVIEYDAAAGNGFCVKCGTVIEENTIVSEVTFGETSNGAAMVQGSYVGQGSTHARMGGPFGHRGSSESREQTIAEASKKIRNVASVLRLSETVSLAAVRLYTLAVEHRFTKGRKNMNVVAVCLYVACRQKETRNYMLIDFSDLLQVNVFELGHTYLQLVQTLNLRLPLVDPSHYISRFAALLEFGDETSKVATDAVRLVQRFDRDWMTKGRRPAGICGACLLLAARMNNFRRSIQEIVQVVKIADTTLKKRLSEFKQTPSGALTLADFRTVWLEEEMDPPAFLKAKETEAKHAETGESANKKKGKKKKKKRKRDEEDDNPTDTIPTDTIPTGTIPPDAINGPLHPATEKSSSNINPRLFNEGILAGTSTAAPLFLPDADEPPDFDPEENIDPSLLNDSLPKRKGEVKGKDHSLRFSLPSESPLEETANNILVEEMTSFLSNTQGRSLADALDDAERRRNAQVPSEDELLGLDEEELDQFIMTEEEVAIKERIWVEINKEYLEAIAARGERNEKGDAAAKSRKRRKTDSKPRDASTAHGSTAAESVQKLLKKNPRYSKRINYDALKDLFSDNYDLLVPANVDLDDKNDGDLYHIDDKSDGEMLVVEEDGGGVGYQPPSDARINGDGIDGQVHDTSHRDPLLKGRPQHEERRDDDLGDDDAEGEDDVEIDDVEEDVWEEGYQQEI